MAAKKFKDIVHKPKITQETETTSKPEAPASEPVTEPSVSIEVPVFEGPAAPAPPAPRRGFTASSPNIPNQRQKPAQAEPDPVNHPDNWTVVDVVNPLKGPGNSRFTSGRRNNTTGEMRYSDKVTAEFARLEALKGEQ